MADLLQWFILISYPAAKSGPLMGFLVEEQAAGEVPLSFGHRFQYGISTWVS
jgi:hypothetical protein